MAPGVHPPHSINAERGGGVPRHVVYRDARHSGTVSTRGAGDGGGSIGRTGGTIVGIIRGTSGARNGTAHLDARARLRRPHAVLPESRLFVRRVRGALVSVHGGHGRRGIRKNVTASPSTKKQGRDVSFLVGRLERRRLRRPRTPRGQPIPGASTLVRPGLRKRLPDSGICRTGYRLRSSGSVGPRPKISRRGSPRPDARRLRGNPLGQDQGVGQKKYRRDDDGTG